MYKSNKYIALAALASAALPETKITGTSLPQSETADFITTDIIAERSERYTVIAPRSKNAAVILAKHCSILSSLNIARNNGDFNISVLSPVAACNIPNVGNAYVFKPVLGKALSDNDLFASTRFASAIAKALFSLHSLNETIAINNSLPIYSVQEIQNRLLADLDEGILTGKLPKSLFSRWEKKIEDVSLWRLTPCIIHSNLSADSFYVKNYVVSGMVDFSDLHIGDPAQDFAWLFGTASPDTVNRIFKVYNQLLPQPDFNIFVERAKLHNELMVLKWLLHGVRTNNQEIVDDAAYMLADLAESVENAERAEREAAEKAMRLEKENRRIREEIELANARKLEELELKRQESKNNIGKVTSGKHDNTGFLQNNTSTENTALNNNIAGKENFSDTNVFVENNGNVSDTNVEKNIITENTVSYTEAVTEAIDVSEYDKEK